MDETLKRLLVGRISVTILAEMTAFLQETQIPREYWPEIMIDSVIHIFERGEVMLEKPFLEMLKTSIDEYQKKRAENVRRN